MHCFELEAAKLSVSMLLKARSSANKSSDPVLLCNDLGSKREAARPGSIGSGAVVPSSGHHSMSVKEAVRIAQSNNFMGLICSSRLLVSSQSPITYPWSRWLLGVHTLTNFVEYGALSDRVDQSGRVSARYGHLRRQSAKCLYSAFLSNARGCGWHA